MKAALSTLSYTLFLAGLLTLFINSFIAVSFYTVFLGVVVAQVIAIGILILRYVDSALRN